MNTKHLISLPVAIDTDLIFARFHGKVLERRGYLVIKTPSNPGYHWGNYLVFDDPPKAGDEIRWPAIFREEFKNIPSVTHITFTWRSLNKKAETQGFCDLGYTFETHKALTADAVRRPAKFNADVVTRVIETDVEWESTIQNQISINEKYDATKFEVFKREQISNYREMAEAGRGKWFGAFLENKLVASLGVFYEGDLGRFQSVVTHPKYQRQGICGRLVFDAAETAFSTFKVKKLVMVADAEYHAAKIYESVGFVPVEETYSLAWWKD